MLGRVIVTVALLVALFALGHGPWHAQVVAAGNGITSFFTGTP